MSIIENALKKANNQGLAETKPNKLSALAAQPEENLENNVEKDTQPIFDEPKISKENFVSINWSALASEGFLDQNDTKSQLAEEFRVIKRPLVQSEPSSLREVLMHQQQFCLFSSEQKQ